MEEKLKGTLAIDLGNTNTVLAFQDENDNNPILIEIPGITVSPGVVPSAIWYEDNFKKILIGVAALEILNKNNENKFFYSNFKRLIGNPNEEYQSKELTPEEIGEKFIKILLGEIPNHYEIKRLVLTAPIDTYKGYRKWLVNSFNGLDIGEIALVDEPTAAGIGINVPFGSKLLIIDIGGSTIDMNIVELEGGEGKAAPIAELLKFNGKDVSSISKQKLRCAQIISKSGTKFGGKDIDKWLVNSFLPSNSDDRNLIIVEKLKCKLSSEDIKTDQQYKFELYIDKIQTKEFSISKRNFEQILINNRLITLLDSLLKNLLNEARGKGCKISDLYSIIPVGGGTQIPLIKDWINTRLSEVKANYPPPVESIAIGALSLTPGVRIKDILNKGLFIKVLNKANMKHFWHPIFFKGQTWPTEKPYELILQASKTNQKKFEIIIGETIEKTDFEIVFENGIPKLAENQTEGNISIWSEEPLALEFTEPFILGNDCLKVCFWIDKKCHLLVEVFNLSNQTLGSFNLGEIN